VIQGGSDDAVDIYDGIARSWSTARLSQARFNLAAASIPSHALAFFAGGESALVDCQCFFIRMLTVVEHNSRHFV